MFYRHVPMQVVCDASLTARERLLFCYLWGSLSGPEGCEGPVLSQRELAARLGLSPSTVKFALRALVAAGWVSYSPGRGGAKSWVRLHSSKRLV